jgi:hypothetical protein
MDERTSNRAIKARMNNPAFVVPDAMQALQALGASAGKGVPSRTLSGIVGSGKCVYDAAPDTSPPPADETVINVDVFIWRQSNFLN